MLKKFTNQGEEGANAQEGLGLKGWQHPTQPPSHCTPLKTGLFLVEEHQATRVQGKYADCRVIGNIFFQLKTGISVDFGTVHPKQ